MRYENLFGSIWTDGIEVYVDHEEGIIVCEDEHEREIHLDTEENRTMLVLRAKELVEEWSSRI